MATITVHEFYQENLDSQGELRWPADKTTAVDDTQVHTLDAATRSVVLTCDVNVRVSFTGSSPGVSGMPVLAAVPNFFKLNSGRGGGQLRFTIG